MASTTTAYRPRAPIVPTRGYVTIREAMRQVKFSASKVMRLAVIGDVRTVLLPGRRPAYHLADLLAAKQAEQDARRA